MIKIFRSRKSRLGLLGVLTAVTLWHISEQWNRGTKVQADEVIPPGGKIAEIDTGGEVPGDPQNAVEDMKQLRVFIGTYQSKTGHFPESSTALYEHIRDNPRDYGLRDVDDAWPAFTNPDNRYSDDPSVRRAPKSASNYWILGKRPDGTPVGGPKLPGQRDVLMWTDTYYHRNIRHFAGKPSSMNPVGFYMVMWDDGQIEKISYDQVMTLNPKATTHTWGFRGQAGIPADAMTYDQDYKRMGWAQGPRGIKGARGQTVDGSRP